MAAFTVRSSVVLRPEPLEIRDVPAGRYREQSQWRDFDGGSGLNFFDDETGDFTGIVFPADFLGWTDPTP